MDRKHYIKELKTSENNYVENLNALKQRWKEENIRTQFTIFISRHVSYAQSLLAELYFHRAL
jgi:hypothetical protein